MTYIILMHLILASIYVIYNREIFVANGSWIDGFWDQNDKDVCISRDDFEKSNYSEINKLKEENLFLKEQLDRKTLYR